ncbi:hypothetical protein HWV62_45513 [Athelia sp. TMB]|nr:hypothetical protein HWV62_45513 [Athelia sp. TMB]
MAFLTPGLAFIARGLLSLVFPFALIVGTRFFLAVQFDLVVPIWATIVLSIVALPVVLTARYQLLQYRHRRRAAALGARMAPTLVGKWPGNLDILLDAMEKLLTSYPGDGHWQWIEKYGYSFNLNFLWEDEMLTYEPEIIKKILATDFPIYVKGEKFRHAMASVLGTGVFNSDGDMWKFHRSMTRPFFSRDRISDFDNFERHAALAIDAMRARLRSGHAVDFQDLIARFTLDSASEFLLGKNVKALEDALPYPHNAPGIHVKQTSHAEEFSVAFADAQFIISQRANVGWMWPITEIMGDKTKAPMKVVDGFLWPIVDEAIAKNQERAEHGKVFSKEEVGEESTLLDHLVNLTSDREVIKDEILNIMIAGRDTTAATLTFLAYFLGQHPEVFQRLREEVLASVGPTARPTYDDVRDMKYLRAVINETLRLFPAVPFDIRETTQDTTWPSTDPTQKPIFVPAGTTTSYSVFVMHRRTDLWGPDALEFDPDRFLDERQKRYLSKNPFIFAPFNAGPRICLGQQFAYNEMSYFLIRLMQSFASLELDFDAQLPETRPPPAWGLVPGRQSKEQFWPKSHLTMYSHGGLWVKMAEASN